MIRSLFALLVLGAAFSHQSAADEARWQQLRQAADAAANAGKHDEATAALEQAVKEAVDSFGPQDPRVGLTWNDLAVSYSNHAKWDDVIRCCNQAIAVYDASVKPGDPRQILSLNNLAHACRSAGRPMEAEAALRRVVDLQTLAAGRKSAEVADALDQLAAHYKGQQLQAQATPLLEESLEVRSSLQAETSTDVVNSLYRLGENLRLVGKPAEAQSRFARAAELAQRRFGPDTAAYLTVLESQAEALKTLDSQALLQDLSARIERLRRIGQWERKLAAAQNLRLAAKWDEAESAMADVLKSAEAFGAEGQPVAAALTELGELRYAKDELPQAEVQFEKSLALYRKILGEGHSLVASGWLNLGATQLSQSKGPQAEASLKQALTANQVSGDPDLETQVNALTILGNEYHRQSRHAEAVAQLEELVVLRKRLNKPRDQQAGQIWNRLGISCLEIGRTDDARICFQQAQIILQQFLEPDSPALITVGENLAAADKQIALANLDPSPSASAVPASAPPGYRSDDAQEKSSLVADGLENPASLVSLAVLVFFTAITAGRRGYNSLIWLITVALTLNPILMLSLLAVLPNKKLEKRRIQERKILAEQLAQRAVQVLPAGAATAAGSRSIGDELTRI